MIAVLVGLAVASIVAFSLIFTLRKTYPVKICAARTDFQNMEGGATCSRYKTVRIIKGTEKLSNDGDIDRKCAIRGGKPVYDEVGGVVGRNFVGCAK